MSAKKPVLYHNPRCSKSREALALLASRGVDVEVVEYLKTPPSVAELRSIAAKLGADARRMVRVKEAAYAVSGLREDSDLDAIARAIADAPVLLERPLLVVGDEAALGRPPEDLLKIL